MIWGEPEGNREYQSRISKLFLNGFKKVLSINFVMPKGEGKV